MQFGEMDDKTPFAIIYWYTFDNLGNPIFLVGAGVPDGNMLEVQFDSPHGMKYGEFNPESVTRENGGTASFEFADQDNGAFSYVPSDFTATAWGHLSPIEDLPLVRIFKIPVTDSTQP